MCVFHPPKNFQNIARHNNTGIEEFKKNFNMKLVRELVNIKNDFLIFFSTYKLSRSTKVSKYLYLYKIFLLSMLTQHTDKGYPVKSEVESPPPHLCHRYWDTLYLCYIYI